MSSWFDYFWPSTPAIGVEEPKVVGLVETQAQEVTIGAIAASAPTPTLEKTPCMVFPGGAITFVPRKCSACKDYRNRHSYIFVQWQKPEGTGRCIKCTSKILTNLAERNLLTKVAER